MSFHVDVVPSTSIKRIEFNLQYCSLAVLFYDYLLTLKDEIEYVWKQPWRLSTFLYVLCRYALVTNTLYVLSISERIPGMSCNTGYMICGVLSVFGRIGILGVWGLRTYAIYGRSLKVLLVLAPLGSACMVAAIVHVPVMRCQGESELPAIRGVLSALMITFEVSAFLLASVRLWSSIKHDMKTDGSIITPRKRTLHSVIFRQGFMYIFAVVGLSVASVILNFKAWKGGFLQRLLNGLKVPLSGFLTARFILRLRKWDVYRQRTLYLSQIGSLKVTTSIDEPRPVTLASAQSPASPVTDTGSPNNPRGGVPDPCLGIGFAKGPLRPTLVEPTSIIEELGDDIGPHSRLPRDKFPEVEGELTESDYQWDWDRVAEEVGWRWWGGIPGPPMQGVDPPVSTLGRACDLGRVV